MTTASHRSQEVALGIPLGLKRYPRLIAREGEELKITACQFCNSNCRMYVQTSGNDVVAIAGEDADPVQAGLLCVKAEMMEQLYTSLERVRTPLKRASGAKGESGATFVPISWEEAYGIIAERWFALYSAGEAHSIANRTTGRMVRGSGALVSRVFELLGSPNDTDVGPTCNDAGGDALAMTFGLGNFTNGYGIDPNTGQLDLGSAEYTILFGSNQAETHPVTYHHLLTAKNPRGRFVVVDPRRTATAELADKWISPKPHTDLALVLGMLYHIINANLQDQEFIDQWVLGFDQLRNHLYDHGYSPDWAARVCDIPVRQIEDLATEFATASTASIFCNAGISHQLSAFHTYRAIAFLSAITGNIGKPGGGCNFMHNTWPGELKLEPVPGAVPWRREALPIGPDAFARLSAT